MKTDASKSKTKSKKSEVAIPGIPVSHGVAVGLVNGFGVAVLSIPSMIFTLGVDSVMRGLMVAHTGGFAPQTDATPLMRSLAAGRIAGIPTAIFFAGQSTILLKNGSTVTGTDSGTLDPPPGQGGFAPHRLPGRDHSQAAGRWDPKRMHRLADDVLAQHRAKGSTPVATPRVGRPARTLKLDIESLTGWGDLLAEQDGPPVPQHGEMAELMAGIGLGEGLGAFRHQVPGEHCDAIFTLERFAM